MNASKSMNASYLPWVNALVDDPRRSGEIVRLEAAKVGAFSADARAAIATYMLGQMAWEIRELRAQLESRP